MSLAWDEFECLEGSPNRNFELLWRGIVQRTWERYGSLRSVRQQPGVEFHLRLESGCDLGEEGRWFGWQCRWYTLREDNGFRADQREAIKKSIRKTVKYLPDLTDYVLCLRQRPAKSDVDWYFALTPEEVEVDAASLPRLHLWDEEDLEPRLSGDAAVLRESFFGELVVTADQLARSHGRSLAPIRERWFPQVHVTTHVEDDLRTALLQPGSVDFLRERADHLATLYADSEPAGVPLSSGLASDLGAVREDFAALAEQLRALVEAVDGGDPAAAGDLLSGSFRPAVSPACIRRLARSLRLLHHPAALAISAAEGAMRRARRLVTSTRTLAAARLIAVVGDPGQGKSHLSATVTTPHEDTMAGVFIAGRDLQHGGTLDGLVARLPELKAGRIDDLLEAADAAGARSGQRVPIVIDGLNEAERPHEWQAELAAVAPALARYPNVLLITTLRGVVADDVLIPEAHVLTLRWAEQEVWEGVRRYFEYYKIRPGSARLPFWLLKDPLFLRLFCEAVNGERESWVGPESIPDDLVAVYELFRNRTAARLARHLNLRPQLVVRKLTAVATALWERRARDLPFEDVQDIVDEPATEWERSIVRAFEQEGILSRNPQESWHLQYTTILFDRFAGYLIADALLGDRNREDAESLLESSGLWSTLTGDRRRRHTLADDIFGALIGVVPRQLHGRQLWHFAPDDVRDEALRLTLGLSSDLVDPETQEALADYIAHRAAGPDSFREHPFDQLWDYHDSPHRLNAVFLDRVLRLMPVARRDASWTEWLRFRTERVSDTLQRATRVWSGTEARNERGDFAARAFTWVLTTTDGRLRDEGTLALQRYGRADPGRIFELVADYGDIDDRYITERLLAASVGAALTHQMPDPGGGFRTALGDFLAALLRWYAGDHPTHPSSHVLIRDHVRTLVRFAHALHPDALPPGVDPDSLSFAPGPRPDPVESGSAPGEEVAETLRMDFQNYTVGSLYQDRANYDFQHRDWSMGLDEIRGRIWEIGWRVAVFGDVDRRIAEDSWRRGRSDDRDRIERYGKKYARIAYYELAGRLSDAGEVRRREWYRLEVQHELDPTFPADPPHLSVELPAWASGPPATDRQWYESGTVEIPELLLAAATLEDEDGPWVLVAGYLVHRDGDRRREVWSHLRSMVVLHDDAEAVRTTLERRPYLGNFFVPGPPSDTQTYAGEMPWSESFLALGAFGEGDAPYVGRLGRDDSGGHFEIEILAHEYASEGGALALPAYGCYVASARLARHFDLRQSPGRLDLVGLDGRSASRTVRAPAGFGGHLLYIREDLVAAYAAGRGLVQLAWGERRVMFDWDSRPGWLNETAEHANLWRRVAVRNYG